MAEPTDWYERGCSRGCRNGHTRVWGWCDLAEEPKPELNLHVVEAFTAPDGNTSVKFRQVTVEEARAELAKFEAAPDWADVREAARKAGWTRTGNRIVSAWTVKAPNGEDDDRYGWAAVFPHHRKVQLTGPGEGDRFQRSFTDLVDPTPAQVLAAARLVGIGGDRG